MVEVGGGDSGDERLFILALFVEKELLTDFEDAYP